MAERSNTARGILMFFGGVVCTVIVSKMFQPSEPLTRPTYTPAPVQAPVTPPAPVREPEPRPVARVPREVPPPVSAPEPPRPEPPHPDQIYEEFHTPGVKTPDIVYRVKAEYSEEGREKNIHGTVDLSVVVGKDGMPEDVSVARPLGFGLDESAMAAVKQWRFQPAMMGGKPVKYRMRVQVSFNP